MATMETTPRRTLGKVRPHQTQNEALVFEKSSPGKRAYKMPPLDVPAVDPAALLGDAHRKVPGLLPELSEIEIIRHFTRLSTWNYAIDLGMYPLGSCTMKYNPRVNEFVARLEGIAEAHPYQPESLSQGALEVIRLLQSCLLDITGMDAITLQPAAGAHGEFTGILLVRAYHQSLGNPRRKIISPDSAHGTNPATAAICGYQVENLRSNHLGMVDVAQLEQIVTDDTAALMLTNPSTIGVFESEIHKIADILHAKGALLYMDGANMNALVGKTRPGDFGVDVMHLNLHKTFSTPHGGGGPGSGPVGVGARLRPFLPIPIVGKEGARFRWMTERDLPQSIGRLSGFMGNAGVNLRAYVYMRLLGRDGMVRVAEFAALNANYLLKRLQAAGFEAAYPSRRASHEFIITLKGENRLYNVTAMDVAKRLLDYGFHSPTTYFPLLVPECLLIEPTETEAKEDLDRFCDAMASIREEMQHDAEKLASAPHTMPVRRLDDVRAAKQLDLAWKPAA